VAAGSTDDDTEPTRRDAAAASPPSPAPASAAPHPLQIAHYTVLGALGRGAMGVVYAAYDDKLDRKVALKLLHAAGDAGTAGRARMLREAQALARVSHPNVVQVYEVGEYDGQIYISMEFVRGVTLRRWRAAAPRSWREALAIYLEAGRGLAAAHRAGLVHRDFKPDNVMLSDDGRVRVMDFGLARTIDRADISAEAASPSDHLTSSTLTAVGAVLGTPAYMAPEQVLGSPDVGAPADQFAFCVALFEALYGARPFAGADLRELAANITRGKIREPPRARVPRWLRRAVYCGLIVDPARRWPTMAALLAHIERGLALARLRVAAAAALLLALVAFAGWGLYRAQLAARADACERAADELDLVWSDDARARLRASFTATRLPNAAADADRVVQALDRHALAWRRARADACLDHERSDDDPAATADTYDRALWCLEERRVELESFIAELAVVDRALIQKAVPAAAGLDPIACAERAALARLGLPPPDTRDEARAIRGLLARSGNLHAAGKFAEAVELAREALVRAQTIEWPPLVAAAHLRIGLTTDRLGGFADAALDLEEAGFAAMRAGALGLAADATTALITLVGQRLARFDDGRRWARLAELAIHALEPEPGLRTASHHLGLAVVRALTGDLAGARELQRRALAIQERQLGPDHLHIASTLQNIALTEMNLAAYPAALAAIERSLAIREAVLGPDHSDVARALTVHGLVLRRMGDYPGALALQQRAAEVTERALGPEHPDLAVILTNLANIHLLMGSMDQVRGLHARALAIREATLGPEHPEVAASLSNLAIAHQATGDLADARDLHLRALTLRERAFGPDHPEVGNSLTNLGGVELGLGDFDRARAHLARALIILEATRGPDHPDLVAVLVNLGTADHAAGRRAAALPRFRRAIEIIERAQGPEHPSLEEPLQSLARALLEMGRHAEAIPIAARAVASIDARGGAATLDAAAARITLADALWSAPKKAGRDRQRARALALQARVELHSAPGGGSELAALERWLAKRR
jgi:tetratricopeptide (TPR) repeat protein/predicted Ser/Thr protein kinase